MEYMAPCVPLDTILGAVSLKFDGGELATVVRSQHVQTFPGVHLHLHLEHLHSSKGVALGNE
jgi:hypothetical protein